MFERRLLQIHPLLNARLLIGFPPLCYLDDYATLETFDISPIDLRHDDATIPAEARALAERLISVCKTTGFFVIQGHGIIEEEIQMHFDLGKMLMDDVPLEEKEKLRSNSAESGQ